MALNATGKNLVLNSGLAGINQMSLHSGEPGANGTEGEVSGTGYARQAITWAAANNGARDLAAEITFTIPSGSITVTKLGLWQGSVYCGTVDSTSPASQPFSGGGQLVIKSAPVTLS